MNKQLYCDGCEHIDDDKNDDDYVCNGCSRQERYDLYHQHEKTLKEDFMEKFPNAPLKENGDPCPLPCKVYKIPKYICSHLEDCHKCWNMLLHLTNMGDYVKHED